MAYVPNWFLLNSLPLWSSFVARKLVGGPKSQLCKNRGSGPTWHGGCLPPTQEMETLAVWAKELCGKERLAGPEVLLWRDCVKAHSRSSLAVLLYYLEQQVWEEGLLDETGWRTSTSWVCLPVPKAVSPARKFHLDTWGESPQQVCSIQTSKERALCQQNQVKTMQSDL